MWHIYHFEYGVLDYILMLGGIMSIITITNTAIDQIISAVAKSVNAVGISIKVVNSGCTGKAYALEFVHSDTDLSRLTQLDVQNALVYVETESIPFMQGAVMDWRVEGLNAGFKFDNPNVLVECGCGKSFSA